MENVASMLSADRAAITQLLRLQPPPCAPSAVAVREVNSAVVLAAALGKGSAGMTQTLPTRGMRAFRLAKVRSRLTE